jgi:hypothetical protein
MPSGTASRRISPGEVQVRAWQATAGSISPCATTGSAWRGGAEGVGLDHRARSGSSMAASSGSLTPRPEGGAVCTLDSAPDGGDAAVTAPRIRALIVDDEPPRARGPARSSPSTRHAARR